MKKWLVLIMVLGMVLVLSGVAMADDTNTVTVSANVLGKCKFNSLTSTLAFGALDPTLDSNPAATGSVTFWCTKGQTVTITDDDGLHETGPDGNRMQHSTDNSELIPYTLSYTPTSTTGLGKTTPITLNLSGTITNVNYVNARVGGYEDKVVISISP